MASIQFHHSDKIRSDFSNALSAMYKAEVPLYGDLLDLVGEINESERRASNVAPQARTPKRIDVERHGAIRLGTAGELSVMRRLFAVMGMQPVGYYDLAVAGVPVHATAFRPIDDRALEHNPFRVFTSLLRLELIEDVELRRQAADILSRRQIFTTRCLELIARAEANGGLVSSEAQELVQEALHTFRWHGEATVDIATYGQLKATHPLIADVVCFRGPHINHLTPRVLDIDRAHAAMHQRGIKAKESIEGPPRRSCPILLRQTSFLALNEPTRFIGKDAVDGSHTARFGEIEQRGCALTRSGRKLYDVLLAQTRSQRRSQPAGQVATEDPFLGFPDDWATLRREGLAFFRYRTTPNPASRPGPAANATLDSLIEDGWITAEPITYEDFLPVSAAGIFRSNLGTAEEAAYAVGGNQCALEAALGQPVHDEIELYEATQRASLLEALVRLGLQAAL